MNKRYWLWGGILGIFVSIIFIFLPRFLPLGLFSFDFLIDPVRSFSNFIYFNIFHCGNENMGCSIISDAIAFVGLSFLVGSLLGWLYGKIKNRNNIN